VALGVVIQIILLRAFDDLARRLRPIVVFPSIDVMNVGHQPERREDTHPGLVRPPPRVRPCILVSTPHTRDNPSTE